MPARQTRVGTFAGSGRPYDVATISVQSSPTLGGTTYPSRADRGAFERAVGAGATVAEGSRTESVTAEVRR